MVSPGKRHYLTLGMLRDLFSALDEHGSMVLVDTFDALEPDALRAVPQLDLVAVGPVTAEEPRRRGVELLLPCDAKACMEWLDTKPPRSVVYASFGSILSVSKRQEEEMRRGLDATGRPYLWVARNVAGEGGATLDGAAALAAASESDGGGVVRPAEGAVPPCRGVLRDALPVGLHPGEPRRRRAYGGRASVGRPDDGGGAGGGICRGRRPRQGGRRGGGVEGRTPELPGGGDGRRGGDQGTGRALGAPREGGGLPRRDVGEETPSVCVRGVNVTGNEMPRWASDWHAGCVGSQ
uniref:Uncharacterized protein n=1 Tax=Oryza brachyantha TaxID=4533 RepID=J3MFG0_ORYBR